MKRTVAVVLAVTLLGGGVAAFLLLRGGNATPGTGVDAERGGAGVAAGLVAATKTAARITEPFRCARGPLQETGTPEKLGAPARFEVRGPVVRRIRADRKRPLVMGVVADARGATPTTLARLGNLAARFAKRNVDVVVSLGGMAQSAPDIEKTLAALVKGRRWLLVAIPGDRESISEHRIAVASLRAAGHLVLDGSRVRVLALGRATVGTFPGASRVEQLVAGDSGCIHDAADADALARALATYDQPRLWLGHAPARQRGPQASDLAIGGIHVGEALVARAVADAGVAAMVHGLVDEAALATKPGSWTRGKPTAHIAAGAIEDAPVTGPTGAMIHGSAVVVEVQRAGIRWRPLRF